MKRKLRVSSVASGKKSLNNPARQEKDIDRIKRLICNMYEKEEAYCKESPDYHI